MVSEIVLDQSYLKPIEWPEKKFKKRYMSAFNDIINHYFVQNALQKQVIVLVSHHKAIKHLVKYANHRTGI